MKNTKGHRGPTVRHRAAWPAVAIGLAAWLALGPALLAAEAQGLVIQGVVRADDGTPLKGIRMLLLDKASGDVVARTVTASDGDYAFEGLVPAAYDVTAGVDVNLYECGAYRATLDKDAQHGVITMDWTLHRKGHCQPCCCCAPAAAAAGAPVAAAGIAAAGATGLIASVPTWTIAAAGVGAAAIVSGATVGSLCLSDGWPCEDQKEPASPQK